MIYDIQISKTQSSRSYAYKILFYLIKENHGLLEDDDLEEHVIPTTFHEETELIREDTLKILKLDNLKYYCKVRNNLLN
jgi:hypothetical protein